MDKLWISGWCHVGEEERGETEGIGAEGVRAGAEAGFEGRATHVTLARGEGVKM